MCFLGRMNREILVRASICNSSARVHWKLPVALQSSPRRHCPRWYDYPSSCWFRPADDTGTSFDFPGNYVFKRSIATSNDAHGWSRALVIYKRAYLWRRAVWSRGTHNPSPLRTTGWRERTTRLTIRWAAFNCAVNTEPENVFRLPCNYPY